MSQDCKSHRRRIEGSAPATIIVFVDLVRGDDTRRTVRAHLGAGSTSWVLSNQKMDVLCVIKRSGAMFVSRLCGFDANFMGMSVWFDAMNIVFGRVLAGAPPDIRKYEHSTIS